MNRKGHLTKHQKTRHRDEVQSRYGTNTRHITCKYTWYRYRYEGLSSIGIGINHQSSIGIGMNLSLVSVSVSVWWYRWNTNVYAPLVARNSLSPQKLNIKTPSICQRYLGNVVNDLISSNFY